MRPGCDAHTIQIGQTKEVPMPGQPPSPPPGAIEFELTDFDHARRVLDELPPGVREVSYLAPGYWEERRRKPLASDRALTGPTIDWLIALPAVMRPKTLCEKFPRIVNHIAETWEDHARTADALGRLLVDERGGRHGFPPEIQNEIRRLQLYAQQLAAGR